MGRRNVFKDLNSVLGTEWLWNLRDSVQDDQRIFKHTKYYDRVYNDTQRAIPDLPDCQNSYENDLFILLYSGRNDVNPNADWLKKKITEEIRKCKDFHALKSICESRELFSLTAAASLFQSLMESTISYLSTQHPIHQNMEIIRRLDEKIQTDSRYITRERAEIKNGTAQQQKRFLKVLNRVYDRQKQRENLYIKLEECYLLEQQPKKAMKAAVQKAIQDVNEIRYILISWGDHEGTAGTIPFDSKILERVKRDRQLGEISKLLGKYKEMLIDKRKNSFAYGEGEKYDLTTGHDLNACLSSDISLLSTPETQPLFMHKFMNSSLTQYRKREAVTKAKGDIIACVDGSGSMSDTIAWAMSLALALQEIAAEDRRKFALIQFGSKSQTRIDEFIPGVYTQEGIMNAASHFFNGGTDFERPLQEAIQLIEKGYQDAEIVFITDGECTISEEFSEQFTKFREGHKLTVTGILIDESDSSCGDSIKPFCNRLYRTSTTDRNDIAADLLRRIDDSEAA